MTTIEVFEWISISNVDIKINSGNLLFSPCSNNLLPFEDNLIIQIISPSI